MLRNIIFLGLFIFTLAGGFFYASNSQSKNIASASPIAAPATESIIKIPEIGTPPTPVEDTQKTITPITNSTPFATTPNPPTPPPASTDSTISPPPTPAPIPSTTIGNPVKLSISQLNISANILHLGLTTDGAVAAPEDAFDVSWFNLGVRPGERGNALISGHTGIWKDGTHSIFDSLHTIQSGDTINIKDDLGNTLTFVVKKVKVYGKDEIVPELFAPSDTANVNIITCHGTWLASQKTYSQRLVVFTELLSSK